MGGMGGMEQMMAQMVSSSVYLSIFERPVIFLVKKSKFLYPNIWMQGGMGGMGGMGGGMPGMGGMGGMGGGMPGGMDMAEMMKGMKMPEGAEGEGDGDSDDEELPDLE